MENLIGLILDNFWFFIILLWILGSFGGKKGKKQQDKNNPNRKYPTPTAGPPIEFPWEKAEPEREIQQQTVQRAEPKANRSPMEEAWEWAEDVIKPRAKAKQDGSISTIQIEDSPIENRLRASERKTERTQTKNHQMTQAPKRDQSSIQEAMNFNKMNKDTIVQGIIWSQVLGKPRSKEPHRTFTMNRKY